MQEQSNIVVLGVNTVELKTIDQNNRGLFAKCELKPWSIVMEVQPICVSVAVQMRNRFCSYCFLEKQVSKCSQCKVLYYCSKDCQREDWKIHKFECSVFRKIVDEKKIQPTHITMELAINLRLWIHRNNNKQIDKQANQMCNLLKFQLAQRISKFQQSAVVLLQNLGVQRNEENISKLIKQQSAVSLNCFTIQDYLCNYESIGIGLYWPANFINHHCHPNCTQIYDGRTLKIVGNKSIIVGEQITISYMPILQSLEKRRSICRNGYLFECFCQYCQVDKMYDQTIMYIKCPRCLKNDIIDKMKKKSKEQFFQQQTNEENSNQSSNQISQYYCEQCKTKLDAKQISEIIEKGNKMLQSISSEKSSYGKAKKSLIELRKLISSYDPRFESCIHRVYLMSLEAAGEDSKIYGQSYILLKQMIELMPKWYRLNQQDEIPYVYAWRNAQLGKLAYNLQKFKKASECTQKAYEIIQRIRFNNSLIQVKQLKNRYEQMKISLSFNKAQIFRKKSK